MASDEIEVNKPYARVSRLGVESFLYFEDLRLATIRAIAKQLRVSHHSVLAVSRARNRSNAIIFCCRRGNDFPLSRLLLLRPDETPPLICISRVTFRWLQASLD